MVSDVTRSDGVTGSTTPVAPTPRRSNGTLRPESSVSVTDVAATFVTGSVKATSMNVSTGTPTALGRGCVRPPITPGTCPGRFVTPPPSAMTRKVYELEVGEPKAPRALAVTVWAPTPTVR